MIGPRVNGGLFAEYPSLNPSELDNGDLKHTYDFRGLYSTLLERWMGIDPIEIVGGTYEQLELFK